MGVTFSLLPEPPRRRNKSIKKVVLNSKGRVKKVVLKNRRRSKKRIKKIVLNNKGRLKKMVTKNKRGSLKVVKRR